MATARIDRLFIQTSPGELAQLSGYSPANVSRHLSYLAQYGIVTRESRGASVFYKVSDPSIYALCDLVCASIARQYEQTSSDRALFTPGRNTAQLCPHCCFRHVWLHDRAQAKGPRRFKDKA